MSTMQRAIAGKHIYDLHAGASALTSSQLDASLVDLAPSAYDMIVASLPQTTSNTTHHPSKAEQLSHLPTSTSHVPDVPNPTPISHHLRSTIRLYNLLSTRTDIDHPLCAECTQILLSTLQRQLDETKKERDGYIAFEKEVKREKEKEGQGMSREEAERRIEKLKVDEKVAIEHLKDAEREREKLDEEMRALEEEEKALEAEEAG